MKYLNPNQWVGNLLLSQHYTRNSISFNHISSYRRSCPNRCTPTHNAQVWLLFFSQISLILDCSYDTGCTNSWFDETVSKLNKLCSLVHYRCALSVICNMPRRVYEEKYGMYICYSIKPYFDFIITESVLTL